MVRTQPDKFGYIKTLEVQPPFLTGWFTMVYQPPPFIFKVKIIIQKFSLPGLGSAVGGYPVAGLQPLTYTREIEQIDTKNGHI